jgi:glycerophosphoryl diester phosphodiesterase
VNYNYDWMFKPGAMKQIAQYADGIGPDYHMLVAEGSTPGHVKLTAMVKEARQQDAGASVYGACRPAAAVCHGCESAL